MLAQLPNLTVIRVKLAAVRKEEKYVVLNRTYLFQPIAVESLGTTNTGAYSFVAELRRKIPEISGDDRKGSFFLFQRISVLIQRYDAIMLHECFSQKNRRNQ